jgi:hypothetical protein
MEQRFEKSRSKTETRASIKPRRSVNRSLPARIASQYFNSSILERSRAIFEFNFWVKLPNDFQAEVLQFDIPIGVFHAIRDFLLVFVEDLATNELLFAEILDALEAAIGLVFKKVGLSGIQAQLENLHLIQEESSQWLCPGAK